MKKIYLASTNNVLFFQTWIQDIRESIPAYHDHSKKIMKIEKKNELIQVIDSGDYDFIVIDHKIISQDEINKIIKGKQEGLVWLISETAQSQKITDYYFVWNTSDETAYNNQLMDLGLSNQAAIKKARENEVAKDIPPKVNKSKIENTKEDNVKAVKENTIKNKVKEEKKPSSTVKNQDQKPTDNDHNKRKTKDLSENQKKILANLQHQGHDTFKDNNSDSSDTENESLTISIADPYPKMITDEIVKIRMEETKKMVFENSGEDDIDNREELLLDLAPYVNQYFQLATKKEIIEQIDRRLLASIDMYDYVNMNRSMKNNQIGVWSPIKGVGVTTFVMNLAFHLGNMSLPLSVMESLKEEPIMYKELKRIIPNKRIIPEEWQSYVFYINKRKELTKSSLEDVESTLIDYKGVYWYPLGGRKDYKESNIEDIPYYMSCSNPKEVMLVDLPNGDFKRDTLEALKNLKELWILLDGSTENVLAYEAYVKTLQNKFANLKISIIFVDFFPYVNEKVIRDAFDFPVLAKLPDLNGEIRKNQYKQIPLMEEPEIEKILRKPFSDIGSHIYEDKYKSFSKADLFKDKPSFMKQLNKVKGFFVNEIFK